MSTETTVLPVAEIKLALKSLFQEVREGIERDRPRLEAVHKALPTWLQANRSAAQETWKVIDILTSKAGFDAGVTFDSAVALPALARTFADGIAAVTFSFEDPTPRMRWFFASTWKEMEQTNARMTASYCDVPAGPQRDEVDAWLGQIHQQAEWWAEFSAVTPAERTKRWTKNDWWPNPGAMAALIRDIPRKERLGYLREHYYGELSGASHLSGTGMIMQAAPMQAGEDEPIKERYFSMQAIKALTLLLGFLSELVLEGTDGAAKPRLRALWSMLTLGDRDAARFYERHYAGRVT